MVSNLGNKEIMAQNIRRHIDRLGMNAKEFALEMNFKYTTVLDWLNAKTYPRIDKIEIMANYFNVEKSDLVEQYGSLTPTQPPKTVSDDVLQLDRDLYPNNHKSWIRYGNELLATQTEDIQEEPLYEYRIYEKLSAGTGSAIYEDHSYDLAYFDKELDHDIASWIYGDSMEPKYKDGQVALIKETGFDYDGAIYAVVWDGQTYIKKVYKEEDGLRLVSLNSKYDDKFARWEEEPRIIGKVVGNFMPMER